MPYNKTTLLEKIEQVRAIVETKLPGADGALDRSNLNVLNVAFSSALQGVQDYVDYVSNQINVITAEGEYLENKGFERGIIRKEASYAEGIVKFTGVDGSQIPEATVFQRKDGVEFLAKTFATITSGEAYVDVIAVEAGTLGNTTAGEEISLITPIAGINNVGVVEVDNLSGGVDTEGDEELRQRILDHIQDPPHGGAKNDYVLWAKSVEGVTRVWTHPEHMGVGSIGVSFVMDAKEGTIIPDATEVQKVQNYIDQPDIRPVTAKVTVFAPTPKALDLEIALNPDSPETRQAVENELRDFLQRKSEPGALLYLSQIREAISIATGEVDHTLISPTANVTHTSVEMPVLGTITWS